MSKKRWITFLGTQCERHGAYVQIHTDAIQEPGKACAYEGDRCRCTKGCFGWTSADEGSFYCNWDEQESEATNG